MITEQELVDIHWRCTRGTHYGNAILTASKYGIQVIEEDTPRLIQEIRQLQAKVEELEALAKARGEA